MHSSLHIIIPLDLVYHDSPCSLLDCRSSPLSSEIDHTGPYSKYPSNPILHMNSHWTGPGHTSVLSVENLRQDCFMVLASLSRFLFFSFWLSPTRVLPRLARIRHSWQLSSPVDDGLYRVGLRRLASRELFLSFLHTGARTRKQLTLASMML